MQAPWKIYLAGFPTVNQFGPTPESGKPDINAEDDCGPTNVADCVNFTYQTALTTLTEIRKNILGPTGTGTTTMQQLSDELLNNWGIANTQYVVTTQAAYYYRLWTYLVKGRPVICRVRLGTPSGIVDHFVTAIGLTPTTITYSDPNDGLEHTVSYSAFWQMSYGAMVALETGKLSAITSAATPSAS